MSSGNKSLANWRDARKKVNKESKEAKGVLTRGVEYPVKVSVVPKDFKRESNPMILLDNEQGFDVLNLENKDNFYFVICDDILWFTKLKIKYKDLENVNILTVNNLKGEVSKGINIDDLLNSYKEVIIYKLNMKPKTKIDGVAEVVCRTNLKIVLQLYFYSNYSQYKHLYYDCSKSAEEIISNFRGVLGLNALSNVLIVIDDTDSYTIDDDLILSKLVRGIFDGLENIDICDKMKLYIGHSYKEFKDILEEKYDDNYLRGDKAILTGEFEIEEFR